MQKTVLMIKTLIHGNLILLMQIQVSSYLNYIVVHALL